MAQETCLSGAALEGDSSQQPAIPARFAFDRSNSKTLDFVYTHLELGRGSKEGLQRRLSRKESFGGSDDLPALPLEPSGEASPGLPRQASLRSTGSRRSATPSHASRAFRNRKSSGLFDFDDLPDDFLDLVDEEDVHSHDESDSAEEGPPTEADRLVAEKTAEEKTAAAEKKAAAKKQVAVEKLAVAEKLAAVELAAAAEKVAAAEHAAAAEKEAAAERAAAAEKVADAEKAIAEKAAAEKAAAEKAAVEKGTSGFSPAPRVPRDSRPTLSKAEMDEIRSNGPDPHLLIPLEAKYWSLSMFSRFVMSCGKDRPQQCSIPDETEFQNVHMTEPEVRDAVAKAAHWLATADALLVGSGAGMGVDSGLGTFRGKKAGVWDGLEAVGLDYADICEPHWFEDDPRLAWGFWNFCYQAYEATTPHAGYELVRSWAEAAPLGESSFTSNIDSHWALSGWDPARIVEVHGAVKWLQCSRPCSPDVWEAPADLGLTEDEETYRAVGELPTCPKCGAVARPQVQMFGKDLAFSKQRRNQQAQIYDSWLYGKLATRTDARQLRIVCLELGSGLTVQTVRHELEMVLERFPCAQLIRVNPEHPGIEARFADRGTSLPLSALEALARLKREMEAPQEVATFVLWNDDGVGIELEAPRTTSVDDLLRLARKAPGVSDVIVGGGACARTGHPIMQKHVEDTPMNEPIRKDFFSKTCGGHGAVVLLSDVEFRCESNPSLEKRISCVMDLLEDYINLFTSPEYLQKARKLPSGPSRAPFNALMKECHAEILPKHGMEAGDVMISTANMGLLTHGHKEIARKSAQCVDLCGANGESKLQAATTELERERAKAKYRAAAESERRSASGV